MKDRNSPRSLIDVNEAAEVLGTTVRHMRALTFERKVPFIHLGRKVRFRRADLEEWLEANTTPVEG